MWRVQLVGTLTTHEKGAQAGMKRTRQLGVSALLHVFCFSLHVRCCNMSDRHLRSREATGRDALIVLYLYGTVLQLLPTQTATLLGINLP